MAQATVTLSLPSHRIPKIFTSSPHARFFRGVALIRFSMVNHESLQWAHRRIAHSNRGVISEGRFAVSSAREELLEVL